MPLDRFLVMLLAVIAAAGATVWLAGAAFGASALPVPETLALALPVAMIAWVGVRLFADRSRDDGDDGLGR